MKKVNVYYSPVICYEITEENEMFSLNAYIVGAAHSENTNLHTVIRNFTDKRDRAENFVRILSESAALPIHIPEISEAFMSEF
ncbi:MAG: hypothetical protein IJD19_03770 [Ruminococcus sp.]|nr:hypothetical protein [Ruminococcus sp.]